jgi:LemA protein
MDQGNLIILGVVAAVLLIPLIWLVATFNRFVRLRQHIQESWADIDVELKRRYDLIPNLVQTVQGYAAHERSVLEHVIALRDKAAANQGPAASQAVDESALLLGLKQVFTIAEGYPRLKADVNFLALQKELANTEDRIAAARRFFNGNVREMNGLRGQFPTNIVGSLFKFETGTFFELSSEAERVVPRVQVASLTQPGL